MDVRRDSPRREMSRRASGCGGLPAAVMDEQMSEQGASLRIQQTEVGQAIDAHSPQQASPGLVIVKTDQRGNEDLLAVAHGADSRFDQRDIRAQVPLAPGHVDVASALDTEVMRPGEQDGFLPGLEELLRCQGLLLMGVDQVREFGLWDLWVHGEEPPISDGLCGPLERMGACGVADRLWDQRGGCRVVALKIGATWAGAEWIGSAVGSLVLCC